MSNPASASDKNMAQKTTFWSLLGNVAMAIIKGVAGVIGNSYALIADAIESTADVLASGIVLFGMQYAKRPADKNHPYGHGKIEPLLTFIVVAFLVTSATVIAYESILHIRTPHQMPKAWTLLVLGGIIVWKEISYRLVLRKSKETNSTALRAEAWHHRSDAITSLMAFVGISVALFLGKGYESADDWAALLASAFIVYNSYLIFRPALGEIMDEHVYPDLVMEIRKVADNVPGILGTEKCYVRKVGSFFHVDLHARVHAAKTVKEGHDIAHALQDALREQISHIGHVLVHIEPAE